MAVHVKICGVTSVVDARVCAAEGADAIGLNFWSGSSRRCDLDVASSIVAAIGDRVRIVGVFVDERPAEIERIRELTGVRWVQLHGDEPVHDLASLLPEAYKALSVAGEDIVEAHRSWPGELLLLDACVPGMRGGTGTTFDWTLAARVAAERRILLAGGLSAANVLDAMRVVKPWGVDVASGVEVSPGVKDASAIAAFVDAARGRG